MGFSKRKTAIITGASRGIGAAIATRLATDGHNIVVNFANSKAEAAAVVEQITADGGAAIPLQADVSEAKAVKSMFDAAEATYGGVDILVNNAAVMKLINIRDASDALFDEHVAVNLKGTFNALWEGATRIRRNGSIVNFSSGVVASKGETYGIYAATKAAVEVMSAIFAKELRGRNINVNTVAPGPTATDLFLDGKSVELVERIAKAAPFERLGQPEDIANVVSFLNGPDGAWVNAQILRANGGLV